MNFIGHAYVARIRRDDSAFVLGAMLPDFFSMARIRRAHSDDPGVTSGIAFHHACDDAFHRGEAFLRLSAQFGDELEETGVGRGPARAVAHVGLELLLDGFLLDRPGVADAYLAAIAEAAPSRLGGRLRFVSPDHHERYAELSRRLDEWGLPDGYRDPEIVGERLVRILGHRPRLALDPREARIVDAFLPKAKDAVERSLPSLVGAVIAGTDDLPIG